MHILVEAKLGVLKVVTLPFRIGKKWVYRYAACDCVNWMCCRNQECLRNLLRVRLSRWNKFNIVFECAFQHIGLACQIQVWSKIETTHVANTNGDCCMTHQRCAVFSNNHCQSSEVLSEVDCMSHRMFMWQCLGVWVILISLNLVGVDVNTSSSTSVIIDRDLSIDNNIQHQRDGLHMYAKVWHVNYSIAKPRTCIETFNG